jgi:hypothetical protein
LVKGTGDVAGIGADVGNFTGHVLARGLNAAGYDPKAIASYETAVDLLTKPHGAEAQTAALSGAARHVIPSLPDATNYTPTTLGGHYLQTAGEFAPSALIGGEAGLPELAARAVVPAVSSETAGQIAPYLGIDPKTARVAGALLGGAGLAAAPTLAGGRASLAAGRAIPEASALRSDATAAYNVVKKSGMAVAPASFDTMVADLRTELKGMGFRDFQQKNTSDALAALDDAKGTPQSLQDLDILKQIANRSENMGYRAARAGTSDASDGMMAGIVGDRIDDFVKQLGAKDVVGGNLDQNALDALSRARNLWARQAKSDTIDNIADMAGLKAGFQKGSIAALGVGDKLQQGLGQLALNEGRMARFTPEEQALIVRAAKGGTLQNLLRTFGKLAPDQAHALMLEGGAAAAGLFGGEPGLAAAALGSMAGGVASKAAAQAITLRQARAAAALMRAGGQIPSRSTVIGNALAAGQIPLPTLGRTVGALAPSAALLAGAP